jgi:hypothetical protein
MLHLSNEIFMINEVLKNLNNLKPNHNYVKYETEKKTIMVQTGKFSLYSFYFNNNNNNNNNNSIILH